MGAAGGFGRRASDGGTHLQTYFQKHIEHSDWNSPIHATADVAGAQRSNPLDGQSTSGGQTNEALEEPQNQLDLARCVSFSHLAAVSDTHASLIWGKKLNMVFFPIFPGFFTPIRHYCEYCDWFQSNFRAVLE